MRMANSEDNSIGKVHVTISTNKQANVTVTSQVSKQSNPETELPLKDTQEYDTEEIQKSPVLKNHSRRRISKKATCSYNLQKISSSGQINGAPIADHTISEGASWTGNNSEAIQPSPIMKLRRKLDKALVNSVSVITPVQKKLVVDESQLSERYMNFPPYRLSSDVEYNELSTSLSQNDSFLDHLDFQEIDSLCSSMESTPKRKVITAKTKRSPFLGNVNYCSYNLRKTPQRTTLSKHSPVNKNKNVEEFDSKKHRNSKRSSENCTEFQPSKSTCVKRMNESFSPDCDSETCIVPESSFSSNNNNGGQNTQTPTCSLASSSKLKLVLSGPQQFHDTSSPDIFDEEPLGPFTYKLSDSFSEKLCRIEEGYFGKCANLVTKKIATERNIDNESKDAPNHTTCLEESLRKSQDSQLSFSSTLDSQPLIDRFQGRVKGLATSQPSAPLKSDSERRSEAVAAAFEEATKLQQLGEDFQLGPYFGLPSKVADVLKEHRGISGLYDWQKECINEGSNSKNLLISVPTSGGKTLAAEIIMMQWVLLKKRDVIFILPYVALVQEKVRGLSPFGVEFGFLVEEYAGSRGSYPPKTGRKKHVIYVATIEKGSGLVNALLETGRMEELGLVVVDEVHMLGEDGGRGARLEEILTKLRFAAPKVQLVAMSATVGNLQELATYLDATLYTRNFRPVQLTEYVKIEDQIWEVNTNARTDEELLKNQRLCCFPYSSKQKQIDSDMVAGLVGEVVPDHSCLVFCPTRRNCETLAELICRILPQRLMQVKRTKKVSLYRALIEEGGGSVCPTLRKTVQYGVAYHHSGLLDGERRLLEEGYLTGTLCCLCCTSTLAAGVNLPARRVIIRSPFIGREFLTRSRYKQMVGRAGRAGLDTSGESFLILQRRDLSKARSLLTSSIESCKSTLADEKDRGLTSLLFSSIGLGIAVCLPELIHLAGTSLLALQASSLKLDIENKVLEMVEDLREQGLVRIKSERGSHNSTPSTENTKDGKRQYQSSVESRENMFINSSVKPEGESGEQLISKATNEDVLTVSRLGKAAIKGSIELNLARRLYKDLCVARDNLAVNCHLHLIFLVTPYSVVNSMQIIPDVFYSAYMSLGEEEVKVARLLGISEAVVVNMITGHISKKVDQEVLQRFYAALLLHRIWSGTGVWKASDSFSIHRGFTQQILTSSAAFASCIYHFCQELEELWAFRDLLGNFSHQLSGCCTAELLPLLDLPAVKKGRAQMLYKAGFRSLQDIAKSKPFDLVRNVEHLPYRTALQIINSAKMLLIERAETLQGEADEMLSAVH